MRFMFVALTFASLGFAACAPKEQGRYQGWVEADLIFVGADETGRIETSKAREGDQVAAGDLLFTLDSDLQAADVNQVRAQLENAQQAFARAAELLKSKTGTQKTYDDAQAVLREAEARLASAQTRLARRQVKSPVSGVVQQVYFRPGEMVSAGRPIISVLPPSNLKIRFFVPEGHLPKIAIGETIAVACDGCAASTARISFISRTAEYTPPVIYSLEERHKLVFLVEARPERPEILRVGQPVTVAPAAKEGS